MNSTTNELAALIALGESRRDAGEQPAKRLSRLGYAPPPGDGDYNNPRNWLTDEEIRRAHEITMALPSMKQQREEARERILAKIAARNNLHK